MIMRGEEVVDGMKSIVAYRILISYCEQVYMFRSRWSPIILEMVMQ